jgi:hypothetical protein
MSGDKEFQYLADLDGLAGEPFFDADPREDEEHSPLGLHYDTLFDQDETEAGDRIDPATGLPYDNSSYLETEGLTVISDNDLDQSERPDMVDRWLVRRERRRRALKRLDDEQTA